MGEANRKDAGALARTTERVRHCCAVTMSGIAADT